VVLLHGFGDTGDMWAPLAIVLAMDHTVIVPDLRGMGMSDHPDTGYTKKNQAVDIAGVMDALKVQKADLVTHDIGNMVGYALAAQYPLRVTRWVVIDAPLPGIGDWDNITRSPMLWHFNFRGPDEERLVQGRERIYLDRFWNELSGDPKGSMKIRGSTMLPIRTAACDARCLRAFGAFSQDAADNRALLAKDGKITMPVFAIGAEKFSARVWPMRCGSPPATSRAASCPTPGTGSWRRIHRPPSSWLQISSPRGLGFRQFDPRARSSSLDRALAEASAACSWDAAISPSTRPPTRSPREYVSLWICRTNQSKEKKIMATATMTTRPEFLMSL